MSVAFDTLKFARALRDKAQMSAEQAEGVAEAFGSATSEQPATKADLAELGADLRAQMASSKVELKADIVDVRTDIGNVKAEVLLLRWMIGFALALLVAVFAKLFLR